MGNILLGCSGWSYEEWVGPFYRSKEESKLARYSKVFATGEIDSTFYAYPSKGVVMGWSRYTPADFVFCAKLPQLITHEKVLDVKKGVGEDLKRFIDLLAPLRLSGKLGCILIQLPPSFKYQPERLEGFMDILPDDVRFAVEFRHPSWMRSETQGLLKNYDVAYTIVDEPLLPPETTITTDFAYLRWHGRGARPWYNYRYKEEELKSWAPRVEAVANDGRVVYGYFNNHYHGYAVENCLQVLDILGQSNSAQMEALAFLREFRTGELRPEKGDAVKAGPIQ